MNIISLPSGFINEPIAHLVDANGLNYQATVLCDAAGLPITTGNPIPVNIVAGGGGGSNPGDLANIATISNRATTWF